MRNGYTFIHGQAKFSGSWQALNVVSQNSTHCAKDCEIDSQYSYPFTILESNSLNVAARGMTSIKIFFRRLKGHRSVGNSLYVLKPPTHMV